MSARPGTAGVADYFAILGVGDTLILKSTQKSTPVIEDEAPPPPTDGTCTATHDGGGDASTASAGAAAVDASNSTSNGTDADIIDDAEPQDDRCFGTVEEECAWTERFYREIVDVKLITAEHDDGDDDNNDDDGDACVGKKNADTATGAGTNSTSSAAIDPGKDNVIGGYEVVRRTAASLAPMMTVRMGKVTAEEQGRDADLNPMSSSGLRAVVLQSEQQELEATSSRRAAGGAGGDDGGVSKTPSKVLSGLKTKVGAKIGKKLNPILQASASQEWLQGAMSTSPRVMSSSSRMDGNISAAASPSHRSGISSCRKRTYHVAFRRRGPDEVDRPAVADVAVCFVRIHRSTIIREDGAATCNTGTSEETTTELTTTTTTTTTTGETKPAMTTNSTTAAALAKRGLITGAGLATQIAINGANRLMASRSNSNTGSNEAGENNKVIGTPRETTPRVSRKHFFPDTVEKPPRGPGGQKQQAQMTPFQLSDVLELPSGYDEWSIPEPYQLLIFPTPMDDDDGGVDVDKSSTDVRPTSPEARLRRTFLFSHSSSALEAGLSPSEASGAGIEALLRTNSPSLSVTSSRGPSPISSDRFISQMPNHLSIDAQEADHSSGQNLETLVPKLLASNSIPLPRDREISYEYVPILAVRRQRAGDEERYHEDPAAVDFSVSYLNASGYPKMFGLGEGNDDDYDEEEDEEDEVGGATSVLRKTGWKVAASTFLSSVRRTRERRQEDSVNTADLTGVPVLLIRHNTPQGFADAPFATSVLDRFPSKNYKGLPMPEEELPMFCYPTGCRLHRAKFQDAPLAQCYGFVVKNEQGDSIHGKI